MTSTHLVSVSGSQVLERIINMAVAFKKLLREPDIFGENHLIWIAAILLNYLGLWQFILVKDFVFTFCLRDEYVFDSIPPQSYVKLYYICLEAMSIFSSPIQLVTTVVHLLSIFCWLSSSFVSQLDLSSYYYSSVQAFINNLGR